MTAKQLAAAYIRHAGGDAKKALADFREYVGRQTTASRSQMMTWNRVFAILAA